MTSGESNIQRKLRMFQHAENICNVFKVCLYFRVDDPVFIDARRISEVCKVDLNSTKPIPKNRANQTPTEIVEKVVYLG